MSTSDAAIVARWTMKLKGRKAMLAFARREESYWSRKYHKAKPGSKARTHAYEMVESRKAKVAHREDQVSEAKRVIARHSKTTTGPVVMYDDVTLSLIPANAPAVAGYVGGRFPTYPELAAKFPHAKLLSVAVNASEDAECLDVEPGDATVAQAAAWVKKAQARGIKRPVVYCSVSQAASLASALKAAGLGRGSYRLWTAHYTGRDHICGPSCGFGMPTTADATQWTDRALGRSLDESRLVADFWS